MITLEANYSKKLGLPEYSSHAFSVSVKTELSSKDEINQVSQELYTTLQKTVDQNIQSAGYLPGSIQGNTSPNIKPTSVVNSGSTQWLCSEKQRELLMKLLRERNLTKEEVNQKSLETFNKEVPALSKKQMSEFITMLMDSSSKSQNAFNRQSRVNGNGGWR